MAACAEVRYNITSFQAHCFHDRQLSAGGHCAGILNANAGTCRLHTLMRGSNPTRMLGHQANGRLSMYSQIAPPCRRSQQTASHNIAAPPGL